MNWRGVELIFCFSDVAAFKSFTAALVGYWLGFIFLKV